MREVLSGPGCGCIRRSVSVDPNVFLAFSILCLIPQTSFSLYLFVYLYVLWGIGASVGIRRCKTISVDVAVAGVYYVMCRSIVGSGCVSVLWRSCGMI